jgi:hypothetical protein
MPPKVAQMCLLKPDNCRVLITLTVIKLIFASSEVQVGVPAFRCELPS